MHKSPKEMAGKLSTWSETSEHQSRKWTVLADRGGLYHVKDVVYYLFAALELVADKELSTIFERKGEGIEKVKKESLSWLCDDDEVQFISNSYVCSIQ